MSFDIFFSLVRIVAFVSPLFLIMGIVIAEKRKRKKSRSKAIWPLADVID